MPIPLENHVLCVTESELMQWVSRGRIHLLMDRILLPGEPRDGSLFAACSAIKLDDAKARVLVSLTPQWLVAEHFHPTFRSRKIFSLPISMVSEVAPTLSQYRRRLDAFKLKISDWCAEEDSGLKLNLHPRASASINTLPLPVERVRLLIGPEGGLSADEIAMTARYQFTDILLGPRVLRTETTALTAITALQVRFGDLG